MSDYRCPFCAKVPLAITAGGSERKCGFSKDGSFVGDNWSCETLLRLRECCDDKQANDRSIGVLYLQETDELPDAWIVLNWYKRRGRTDRAIVINEDEGARQLTLADALHAISLESGEVP